MSSSLPNCMLDDFLAFAICLPVSVFGCLKTWQALNRLNYGFTKPYIWSIRSLKIKGVGPTLIAFDTETESCQNGSRDESRDRDQVVRLHHWHLYETINIHFYLLTVCNKQQQTENKWSISRHDSERLGQFLFRFVATRFIAQGEL